jgi:fumarate hydratase, class I
MPEFAYQEMFPLAQDTAEYRRLTADHVGGATFEGQEILKIAPAGLTLLAEKAFTDVAHLLRPTHLKLLAKILKDPEASDNDRYVALEMLKNAVISAEGQFPMCQDTGTAIIMGKKGQQVWTGSCDEKALSEGIFNAYTRLNLRYSQNAALSMFEEKNTGCNLPAQIELYATEGKAYKFLFIAKGGRLGQQDLPLSGNQGVLTPATLLPFMVAKMKTLGTAACPPYHLAFVVGGTSAEVEPQDRQAGLRGLSGPPARDRQRGGPGLPRQGTGGAGCFRPPGNWGSAPSSAANISAWTSASSASPATGPHVPSAWGSAAAPTATSRPRSPREGIFLEKRSSKTDPARYPAGTPGSRGARRRCAIDLDQTHEMRSAPILSAISGGDPSAAERQNRRRPGHRPRASSKSGLGPRRRPAPILQGPHHLLRRAGQNP